VEREQESAEQSTRLSKSRKVVNGSAGNIYLSRRFWLIHFTVPACKRRLAGTSRVWMRIFSEKSGLNSAFGLLVTYGSIDRGSSFWRNRLRSTTSILRPRILTPFVNKQGFLTVTPVAFVNRVKNPIWSPHPVFIIVVLLKSPRSPSFLPPFGAANGELAGTIANSIPLRSESRAR